MRNTPPTQSNSRRKLRIAVTAAALAVAGCLTAAFSFSDSADRTIQVADGR